MCPLPHPQHPHDPHVYPLKLKEKRFFLLLLLRTFGCVLLEGGVVLVEHSYRGKRAVSDRYLVFLGRNNNERATNGEGVAKCAAIYYDENMYGFGRV
jgi:hypothetical protein